MLKNIEKTLTILLVIYSIVTFVNIVVFYWLPIDLLICSFSALRVMFIAFVERKYYLILISILICAVLFLSAISIRRKHILLPILTLLYIVGDFIVILSLLIDGVRDGYWKAYIIQATSSTVLIVLLCAYLARQKTVRKKTVNAPISSNDYQQN